MNTGSANRFHSVKLSASEARIGPPCKKTKPTTQGEMQSQNHRSSCEARLVRRLRGTARVVAAKTLLLLVLVGQRLGLLLDRVDRVLDVLPADEQQLHLARDDVVDLRR